MQSSTDNALSKENISKHLKNKVDILCFDSIDSTNNETKRIAKNTKVTPTLIVAKHQSAGRGRLGRTFYSPKDTGLYMSLLINTGTGNASTLSLTSATAVYVCQAISKLTALCPQIKWVNDVYIDNKKVCGILCESITDNNNEIKAVIIGIGINISTTAFPADLEDIATSLDVSIDKNLLCAYITDKLIDYITFGDCNVLNSYKDLSLVLNKEITYTHNGITKTATAIDIDNNGGLVIKDEGSTILTLNSGEITVRLK